MQTTERACAPEMTVVYQQTPDRSGNFQIQSKTRFEDSGLTYKSDSDINNHHRDARSSIQQR